MKNPFIKAIGLTKRFIKGSQEILPVNKLNFEVQASEFVSLMGPSGSGKTTLLNLIAGIDSPSDGSLLIGGKAVHDMTREQLTHWRSKNVGYIFQLYHLMPVLTAFENVELPLLLTDTPYFLQVSILSFLSGIAEKIKDEGFSFCILIT
mgnify:CR=1 FL=1